MATNMVLHVRRSLVLVLVMALGSASACSRSVAEGKPTGAVCPPESQLTYESFGRPFMEVYCTDCHSSQLTGAERERAPRGHDFDTLEGILRNADHIDEYTASGPLATNTLMPPDDEDQIPSAEERVQLGEWLACLLAPPADGVSPR